jgi:hypothetical protein
MKFIKRIPWLLNIIFLLVIVLVGCQGETVGTEPAAPVIVQTKAVPTEVPKTEVRQPTQFSFTLTDDLNSRWQNITLTVMDEIGNPLPGVEVSVEQTDLDFFFDTAYNPDAAWVEVNNGYWDYSANTTDIEERKQEYSAVGFNADLGFYSWWWKDFEPVDDDWQNLNSIVGLEWFDGNFTPRGLIPGCLEHGSIVLI